jgi:LysR family transcriptional regulator, transcription activator of glutamate synthase operon
MKASSSGSLESAPGPVAYREIPDPGVFRDICLSWSAERRLLPAAELFRRHAIRRAATGKLPEVQGGPVVQGEER